MPDIGSSLREARMRARIDITEAEADTKIRSKYLRALENEEWSLLPGPTFVKSFLRTYGDYLGLDGRTLVEQFKLSYEEPELQPIAPPGGKQRDRPRRGGGGGGGRGPGRRGWLVVGLLVLLLGGLFLLGRDRGDGGSKTATTSPAKDRTTTRTTPRTTTGSTTTSKPEAPKTVRLRVVPTAAVYVCLKAAGDRTLVNGVIQQPGEGGPTYRSSRFVLTLGNGDATLIVDGKTRQVPSTSNGIGYEVTPKGVTRLSAADRPNCSS
jgi:cytoskeleton protein RodZ